MEPNLIKLWSSRLGLYNKPTAYPKKGKTPPTSVLDGTKSDVEASVILELCEMQCCSLLPLLPGPL